MLTLLICFKIILVLVNKQSLWGFSPNRISPQFTFSPHRFIFLHLLVFFKQPCCPQASRQSFKTKCCNYFETQWPKNLILLKRWVDGHAVAGVYQRSECQTRKGHLIPHPIGISCEQSFAELGNSEVRFQFRCQKFRMGFKARQKTIPLP